VTGEELDLTARLLDALTRGDHDQHDALYREVYRFLKAGGRLVGPDGPVAETQPWREHVRLAGQQWTNERDDRPSRVVLHKRDDGAVIVIAQAVHEPSAQAVIHLEDRWSAAMFLAGTEES
jgi:hypothetical protein